MCVTAGRNQIEFWDGAICICACIIVYAYGCGYINLSNQTSKLWEFVMMIFVKVVVVVAVVRNFQFKLVTHSNYNSSLSLSMFWIWMCACVDNTRTVLLLSPLHPVIGSWTFGFKCHFLFPHELLISDYLVPNGYDLKRNDMHAWCCICLPFSVW